MSRKGMVILVGALLLVPAAGVLVCWLIVGPLFGPINEANALKIKPGMALAEVEQLLGGPARDELGGTPWPPTGGPRSYCTCTGMLWRTHHCWADSKLDGRTLAWTSAKARITVQLDEAGRVLAVETVPVSSMTDYVYRLTR